MSRSPRRHWDRGLPIFLGLRSNCLLAIGGDSQTSADAVSAELNGQVGGSQVRVSLQHLELPMAGDGGDFGDIETLLE